MYDMIVQFDKTGGYPKDYNWIAENFKNGGKTVAFRGNPEYSSQILWMAFPPFNWYIEKLLSY